MKIKKISDMELRGKNSAKMPEKGVIRIEDIKPQLQAFLGGMLHVRNEDLIPFDGKFTVEEM